MRLAAADRGMGPRGDNFNLIRLLAAASVLYSHSFALSSGAGRSEPLRSLLGMSLGTLAVSVFFVVSGFLVTASLLSRPSITSFLLARARRIYPALWVALGLTVLLLGPMATSSSVRDYLADPRTWFYLAKNATLVFGFADGLPGVFAGLPMPRAINGSLWTLPTEVRLYLVLALMFGALRLVAGRRADAWMRLAIAVVALTLFLRLCLQGVAASQDSRFATLFFGGALLQVGPPALRPSAPGAAVLVAACIAAAQVGGDTFLVVFTLAIVHLVIHLSLMPSRVLAACRPANDYSYGLYIYGFPVQQTILSLAPGLDAPSLFFASAAIAFALAALSWHLVERPCLAVRPATSTPSIHCVADRGAHTGHPT